MIDAYPVAEVRSAERALMAQLPDGELMARAAGQLATVTASRLRKGSRVVALVGGGDNGGDALYAAASLARAGAPVAVVGVAGRQHPGGLAAVRDAGVQVVTWTEQASQAAYRVVAEADVVLDGILGIGGRPGLSEQLMALLEQVPADAYVIAVDLPSGADPAGEQATAACVFADETVTFGVAKPVHLMPATEHSVGRLTVADIGLDVPGPAAVQRLTGADVAARWPRPGPRDDKYSRGVLGVVAGGEVYTGAAVLSVTAAVGCGVGMVRYVGPPTPTMLVRAAVPEAVHGPGRVQAWVVGPGLDAEDDTPHGRAQRDAALAALASDQPCVVDAGGLDLVDQARSAPTLLTPHAGELARMLSRFGPSVQRSQVEQAPLAHGRRLADATGCTVLVKGHTVLVVPPSGEGRTVRSQSDGPAWLATAGSGDVLSGVAGALLSAGLSPLDAGSVATHVHGLAGHAANPGGPVRALAVAHELPGVVARVLAPA